MDYFYFCTVYTVEKMATYIGLRKIVFFMLSCTDFLVIKKIFIYINIKTLYYYETPQL